MTKKSSGIHLIYGILSSLQIPGSITHNSLLNLTVWCYRGDSLIFTNTTTLLFNLRNVSSFIQTDRSRYQPGDTIQVRIVFVQLDNRPYKGMVEMSVQVGVCILTGRTQSEELVPSLVRHCLMGNIDCCPFVSLRILLGELLRGGSPQRIKGSCCGTSL